MCGIAGLVKQTGAVTADDRAAVLQMMDAQAHRGPDGSGLHHDRRVVLGHRRLSVIDLSEAGRQPMSNERCSQCSGSKGIAWVTYNGEIYNFQELRDELVSRGHQFKSKTDTEVLVHGYVEWGIEGLLARLRGMFAFALYASHPQSSASRLYLAKDRLGIKPLYYFHDKEKVIFASEVRAIMKTGMVLDETNLEALVRFLQLGSVPVPLTTKKKVFALPAAHYLAIDDQGLKLKQYWDLSHFSPPSPETFTDFDNCITTMRQHLEEAVKCHLISDVPIGVFLSGGTDSSALVALASRFRDKPLTTLSIVFEEPEYNERAYANLVAKRYRTNHHQVLLRSKDVFSNIDQVFSAMDQPSADGVNSYFVSKAAKEAGLTVVFSGTGGDELFLGYDHFRKLHSLEGAWRLFSRLPLWAWKRLIEMARWAGPLAGRRVDKLAYLEAPSHENAYLVLRGLFSPQQIQDLLGISDGERDRLGYLPSLCSSSQSGSSDHAIPESLLDSFVQFEFTHYLQNQLLKDVDAMSMAHSIETRVPLLDHKLVEYVSALPTRLKLNHGVKKPLFLAALGTDSDFLRKVWDRPKMGFTFPFAEWLKEQAEELQASASKQKLMDQKVVESIWKGFKEGRLHWSRPWATVVISKVIENQMR